MADKKESRASPPPLDDAEADAEAQPLLDPEDKLTHAQESTSFTHAHKHGNFVARLRAYFGRGPCSSVTDNATYDSGVLLSWTVFTLAGAKTVWHKANTWYMMLKLVILSLVVAGAVLLIVPNPSKLESSKFQAISLFLRVFVGLLLGFFMTNSVNRWFACASGFMELYDRIRNLQMQFFALGVSEDRSFQCMRYGICSCMFLTRMLEIECLTDKEEQETQMAKMWAEIETPGVDSSCEVLLSPGRKKKKYAALTPEEVKILRTVDDPAGMLWIWVASLVGRMAQDGDIPPMASPTYGRVMSIAQSAHDAMRGVKHSIKVQAPFIYVHMLATLVHINNIANVVGFGLTFGSTLGTLLENHRRSREAMGYDKKASVDDIRSDMENLVVMFFVSLVGPLIYQALLDISICISRPFASKEGMIPTDRLLAYLEKDLSDAVRLAKKPPSWDAPCFRQ